MAESRRRYVALLRAINVGGNTVVKMADLRRLLEEFGLTEVTTYIQTGNVLFSTGHVDAEQLARRLEAALASSLGRRTVVFVLSPDELKRAATRNPFDPRSHEKDQECQLMFLSARPDAARRKALLALQGADYSFHVHGKVLYYAYPRQYEGRRRTIDFERVLGVGGTSRNWRVVDKLVELSS